MTTMACGTAKAVGRSGRGNEARVVLYLNRFWFNFLSYMVLILVAMSSSEL
jgi:hypothetical protein